MTNTGMSRRLERTERRLRRIYARWGIPWDDTPAPDDADDNCNPDTDTIIDYDQLEARLRRMYAILGLIYPGDPVASPVDDDPADADPAGVLTPHDPTACPSAPPAPSGGGGQPQT